MKRRIFAKAARSSRPTPGKMNQTERRYELERMIPALADGAILDYGYERITLTLTHASDTADTGKKGMRFTPDFDFIRADGTIWLIDVKARRGTWTSMKDDALAKMKMAAEKFWMFRFAVATFDSKTRHWIEDFF